MRTTPQWRGALVCAHPAWVHEIGYRSGKDCPDGRKWHSPYPSKRQWGNTTAVKQPPHKVTMCYTHVTAVWSLVAYSTGKVDHREESARHCQEINFFCAASMPMKSSTMGLRLNVNHFPGWKYSIALTIVTNRYVHNPRRTRSVPPAAKRQRLPRLRHPKLIELLQGLWPTTGCEDLAGTLSMLIACFG